MFATMTDYVTVQEAARTSGYNQAYLRRLIRNKRIDAELKGNAYWVNQASLDAYLQWVKSQGTQRFNWRRREETARAPGGEIR